METDKTNELDPEVRELAEKAIANYQETPESEWGDLFVMLTVDGEPFVRSTTIRLEETFTKFWESASEWAWVEVKWWCDDHHLNDSEMAAIVESIAPDLYLMDLQARTLSFVDEKSYCAIRSEEDRINRQFAFLDTKGDETVLLDCLNARLEEVYEGDCSGPWKLCKR